jgi:hypothetical protein
MAMARAVPDNASTPPRHPRAKRSLARVLLRAGQNLRPGQPASRPEQRGKDRRAAEQAAAALHPPPDDAGQGEKVAVTRSAKANSTEVR